MAGYPGKRYVGDLDGELPCSHVHFHADTDTHRYSNADIDPYANPHSDTYMDTYPPSLQRDPAFGAYGALNRAFPGHW